MVGGRITWHTLVGGCLQGPIERCQLGQGSPRQSQLSKVGVRLAGQGDTVVEFVRACRSYESEVVRVWTIRNGKVAKVRSFYDTAANAMAIDALRPARSGGD